MPHKHSHFKPDSIKLYKNTSWECQVLSLVMHLYCHSPDNCDCVCHLQNKRDSQEKKIRRPHSYPRKDWVYRKPPGWHEAMKLKQK